MTHCLIPPTLLCGHAANSLPPSRWLLVAGAPVIHRVLTRLFADTAAAGDGRNDVSMLTWAGLGVAVEGSEPEVIAAAGRTIPGPGHGGIDQLATMLLK